MKILCYGDSNTYGYDGASPLGGRFDPQLCWPALLGRALGCESVNCGLNGRRVPRFSRQTEADLALLRRAAPCELVLVMLGTNDILSEAEPDATAECMRAFLPALHAALPESTALLFAPPAVTAFGPAFAHGFAALAGLYEQLAAELGIPFADASRWDIPTGPDGIHFSARGHRLFAMKAAQTLHALLR